MEEIFDIYTEDGVKKGTATRKEAHEKKLIHKSVMVFLFNPRGELFLQKRSESKDLYTGMLTGSVSGHIDSGEDALAAAKREMREEIGVSDIHLEKIGEFRSFTDEEREIVTLFRCEYEGEMQINKEEIQEKETGFYSLGEISKLDFSNFTPCLKKGLKFYLINIGKI